MTKRKLIGIPGYKHPDGSFFGAGVNHLEFINTFGDVRIIAPWEKKVEVDLLYLPGGLDMAPESYDDVPGFRTSNQDVMKEFFYRQRLKYYVVNTPIFGVCLGFQMLGVYFGSKLTQNLINHPQSEDRWLEAHPVMIVDEKGRGLECINVNSHHHQCIMKSQLERDLQVLCRADCEEPNTPKSEYIVEAFKHKTLPIVGVQWHPEELYDYYSNNLINQLLNN